ncbi:hypothetical protein MSM1_15610 [Mycobacterium sp. SM1]|uniref:hypothetical protein n=1 Tax=Mycobacterium sp. SM1 TaxID=2816243 RepID=UPI001BCB985D|nr:hypothetical protein [Mycobacterium sp. SM1]MBS4729708.1 hypothetical protein [Mycobacterium sp. SM1]
MMAVATFVLAVIGAATGVGSLAWNVVSFMWQGGRPHLTPIIGILDLRGGLASADASRDIRQSLASNAAELPPGSPLVVGVSVVNAGRAPFHVARWELRSDPGATSFTSLENMPGSQTVPCDIAPGASATFFTALNNAYALEAAARSINGKPQRITVRVESGGRVYETDPIASGNIALGAPRG